MRTRPHSTFWAAVYSLLFLLQTGWPGWAGAAAGALFFLGTGRAPAGGDAWTSTCWASPPSSPASRSCSEPELHRRTLELLNWVLVAAILGTLTVLCLLLVAPGLWLSALLGFVGYDRAAGAFRLVPEGADFFLIGAFAAYSGSGGVINIALANWARDKGYGMGGTVGFIPALREKSEGGLAPTGRVFVPDRRPSRDGPDGGASSSSSSGGSSSWAPCSAWPSPPCSTFGHPARDDLAGLAVATELARALSRTAACSARSSP